MTNAKHAEHYEHTAYTPATSQGHQNARFTKLTHSPYPGAYQLHVWPWRRRQRRHDCSRLECSAAVDAAMIFAQPDRLARKVTIGVAVG